MTVIILSLLILALVLLDLGALDGGSDATDGIDSTGWEHHYP